MSHFLPSRTCSLCPAGSRGDASPALDFLSDTPTPPRPPYSVPFKGGALLCAQVHKFGIRPMIYRQSLSRNLGPGAHRAPSALCANSAVLPSALPCDPVPMGDVQEEEHMQEKGVMELDESYARFWTTWTTTDRSFGPLHVVFWCFGGWFWYSHPDDGCCACAVPQCPPMFGTLSVQGVSHTTTYTETLSAPASGSCFCCVNSTEKFLWGLVILNDVAVSKQHCSMASYEEGNFAHLCEDVCLPQAMLCGPGSNSRPRSTSYIN